MNSIAAAFGRAILGVGVYAAFLFIPAGTIEWPLGWVLIAILAYAALGEVVLLAISNRALLEERARPLTDPAYAAWDRRLTVVAGGLFLSVLVVAGLDHRFGWTPPLPPWLSIAGVAIALTGNSLFLWSMASNRTFFRGVRIDRDRHEVARSGPYLVIRHPGYLGAIAAQLGQPLAAGTLAALIPALAAAAIMVRRTALEDRFLTDGLAGYAHFAEQTRFRLVPLLW